MIPAGAAAVKARPSMTCAPALRIIVLCCGGALRCVLLRSCMTMKTVVDASGVMYPNPVVLVTAGHGRHANIITVAWAGTVCGQPWMVGIGVRPATYSHGLLMQHREFVVNVPTAGQLKAVELCGSLSGRDVNKWEAAGLHPDASESISTPGIAECPVSMECRLRHTLDLGLHTLFIGEVLRTRRDPAWKLVPPPLVYMEGRYHTTATMPPR